MNDHCEMERYLADDLSRRAVAEAADLPTERARDGQFTLTSRGFRLHSAVNPVAEADQQLAGIAEDLCAAIRKSDGGNFTVLIFGPGLGHLLRPLQALLQKENGARRIRVICVETDPEIARKAVQLRVWEPADLPVLWIVGPKSLPSLREIVSGPHFCITATAGFRLNKESYEPLIASLAGRVAAERPMRILVPTPLYGGSLPVALHCAEAFREIGHHVELLDFSEYYSLFRVAESVTHDARHTRALQNLLTTCLAETVVAKALDWRADLVWAVAQSPLLPPALQELRHEGVHSALWFVEDFRIFSYWRELAPHFDAVFTIQRGEFHDSLRSLGVPNVLYLPCAANPHVHAPLVLSDEDQRRFNSDVSFVGAGYPNRQRLFARLGLPGMKIWGNDWPKDCAALSLVQENGRRVTTEETAKIYNAGKVNLNLHSSPHHDDVNPHGDFVNPRTFEIAACGAFQLVDHRSELNELFAVGDELAVFHNGDEIPPLVNYYLTHEEERRNLAQRARQRVLREHTYTHRMQTALQFCEERLPGLAQRKRGPSYVSALKAAAADDPELLEFLSGFPEDQEITLDEIVSRIQVGNGKLSRAEGIFLLMKEFRDWGKEKGVIQ
jgi:spore maturation protein CgeB